MSLLKRFKDHLTYVIKGGEDENIPDKPDEPEIISVLMMDGSIEEYPENFMITDGVNCCIRQGDCYHTHLDCEIFKHEKHLGRARGMTIKDAEKQGIYKCPICKDLDELYKD